MAEHPASRQSAVANVYCQARMLPLLSPSRDLLQGILETVDPFQSSTVVLRGLADRACRPQCAARTRCFAAVQLPLRWLCIFRPATSALADSDPACSHASTH